MLDKAARGKGRKKTHSQVDMDIEQRKHRIQRPGDHGAKPQRCDLSRKAGTGLLGSPRNRIPGGLDVNPAVYETRALSCKAALPYQWWVRNGGYSCAGMSWVSIEETLGEATLGLVTGPEMRLIRL